MLNFVLKRTGLTFNLKVNGFFLNRPTSKRFFHLADASELNVPS